MRRALPPALSFGAILIAFLCFVALISFVWTPADPAKIAIARRLQNPSALNLLGTDQYGRDVASLLMVGARNTLTVAFGSVGLGALIGVALGFWAASARGGVTDMAVMRLLDITFAFPAVLSAVMLSAALGPGVHNAVIAIAVFSVPVFARVTRGAAIALWSREFVQAARALGLGRVAITMKHVLPNLAGVLFAQASIQIALAILAEAGLSYLGLGTQPPNPSWGRMLSEAQSYLDRQPLLAVFPGLAIALSVFGFNLLGDGLGQRLDPRATRRVE